MNLTLVPSLFTGEASLHYFVELLFRFTKTLCYFDEYFCCITLLYYFFVSLCCILGCITIALLCCVT